MQQLRKCSSSLTSKVSHAFLSKTVLKYQLYIYVDCWQMNNSKYST